MDTKYLVTGVVCSLIAFLALWGMYRAWRKRQRTAAALGYEPQQPVGEPLHTFGRVLYVVTTSAENRMQRVSLPGLIYRGYAAVATYPDAITVTVTGERTMTLRNICGVSLGRNSIAKAVEAGGLVNITWRAGESALVTTLRFPDPAEQEIFITDVQQHLVLEGSQKC